MLNPFLLLLVYTFCPVSSRWKMHQIFPIRFGTPGNTHEKLWNADSFHSEKLFLEPVFTRNMCGFSSIILLQTRQKYAGGLSVAIHPSATLLCSRAESCLERSRPASVFHAVCSKICRKGTCIRLWRQVLIPHCLTKGEHFSISLLYRFLQHAF